MIKDYFYCIFLLISSIASYLIVFLPKINCTTEISAMCTGYYKYSHRGFVGYYPLFEYEYKGVKYNKKSLSTTKKKYLPLYQYGTWHKIWIDERHPRFFVSTRRYTGADFKIIICSTAFFLMSSFALIAMLGKL